MELIYLWYAVTVQQVGRYKERREQLATHSCGAGACQPVDPYDCGFADHISIQDNGMW